MPPEQAQANRSLELSLGALSITDHRGVPTNEVFAGTQSTTFVPNEHMTEKGGKRKIVECERSTKYEDRLKSIEDSVSSKGNKYCSQQNLSD